MRPSYNEDKYLLSEELNNSAVSSEQKNIATDNFALQAKKADNRIEELRREKERKAVEEKNKWDLTNRL